MKTFFEIGLDHHIDKDCQLMKIDKLLKWYRFRKILKNVHGTYGPTGYDTVQLFKCLLLQAWHSLSDAELERSLRVRLDFMKFTGIMPGEGVPDETTFCRFRGKLTEQGKIEKLFAEVNKQLESHGLKVKAAAVAIVDATIIESQGRPKKRLEVDTDSSAVETVYGADEEARWLKKGAHAYYGYRGYVRTDEEGYIDKAHVAPANKSESPQLATMLEGVDSGVRVQADKGFSSGANREMLRDKGLKSGLMHRAFRNKPLTHWQKQFNKLVSKTRWRVEQCFGTLKRRFTMTKASYFTTKKVQAQFQLKALCLNLLKAVNKVSLA